MPKKKGGSSGSNLFSVLSGLKEPEPEPCTASTTTVVAAGCAAVASTSGAAENGKPKKLQNPLVWIDLEMTGLDCQRDTIIEIACIVTDGALQQVFEGPAIAIHHSKEVMEAMNEWCIEHHGKSGLTQRVHDSVTTMEQAEAEVLDFIKQHIPDAGVAQLAGNSVHVDRMFLVRYMPAFVSHLSYRIVDVSSVKELARRWFPNEYKRAPRKVLAHTALSDIRESIEELRYWRASIFKAHPGQGNKGGSGKK